MNNQEKNNKRTYGYTDNTNSRKVQSHGDLNLKKNLFEKKKTVYSEPKTNWDWEKIMKTPFVLLGKFLGLLWKLWQKRPRLQGETKKDIFKKLLWMGITALILGFLVITILIAWASKDLPDPDKLIDRQVDQSTKIYDRTGEHILYEIFADKKRTIVELEEIPEKLINGAIATEDNSFYEHNGVIFKSFIRAIAYKVLGRSSRLGGTSTLTQQLVKNAILTDERKISRKIKEIILSIRLEQKYSKNQILKIYFNEIPYGSTNYGVEAASQSYFGKHVSDLDLQECATLAGLPKAPSKYLNNPEALKNRRDFVLERMYEENFITREEADEAQKLEITLSKHFGEIKAPHFVLYIKEQLVEKYGEKLVDSGGLKVITTLDWEMQQAAEKAVEEESEKTFEKANANNTALVAMDPKTGQVLSMIGSRDFYNEEIAGQFNVATLGKRQPGSSFKPIIYTAAFEKGYTPETVLFDVVTNFAVSGKPYQPLNYDLQEHGSVSMRKALQGSLNIPAVKTLYLVGSKKGVEFAERLGYSTLGEGSFGLSLVLGGGEVKLLEHVAAYGIFANDGVKQETVSILKIEDSEGKILEEWEKNKGEKILDQKITDTITGVLKDDNARAYAFGTNGILTVPGREVAAKTGTTNNYKDAWTVGYTPNLVAGVWAGNTDNSDMTRGYGGSKVAAPIWNSFMKEALKKLPNEELPNSPENDAKKPALRGSANGGITLKIDKATGKIATSSTPEKYIVERTYLQPHSLLHYVQKDDPRSSAPENPGNDPQYYIWEASIQDWIKRRKEENPEWEISFEEPPTEYDDIHSLELIPSLEIIHPTPSSTLTSRQIDTDIRASAPRGVGQVSYKIDGKYVDVVKAHPFNLNKNISWLEPGKHILTIIVEDDVGNTLEENINFILEAEKVLPGVSWVGGVQTTSQKDFPKTFFLNLTKVDEIKEVKIYKKKAGEGDSELIKTVSDLTNLYNNQIIFTWEQAPEKGNWQLLTEVGLDPVGSGKGDTLNIEIK